MVMWSMWSVGFCHRSPVTVTSINNNGNMRQGKATDSNSKLTIGWSVACRSPRLASSREGYRSMVRASSPMLLIMAQKPNLSMPPGFGTIGKNTSGSSSLKLLKPIQTPHGHMALVKYTSPRC